MVTLVVVPVSAVTATPAGKNTASRSTNAVALSGQAQEYYTDEIKSLYGSASSDTKVYQSFADLANNVTTNGEGTSWDAAQNNDLYDVLHNIMKDTHTHFTSYAGTSKNALATHWKTTDTSSSDAREYYTMFYSDKVVFNNEKMQREHIWPKSRASFLQATGGGGSDLHHLRPAYGPVNLAKLNYAFGNVKDKSYATAYGYPNEDPALWRATVYADNNTTYIDVRDDVRGDVARILLYVYTRWHEYNLYSDLTTTDDEGNTVPDMDKLRELDEDDKLKGNTGEKVIQSLPVLLQWMQQDPVSEWEMKRNDLTEDIQGNRNVFIDYPELAWLLFDQAVPSNMDTPSGMAWAEGDLSRDIAKKADKTFTTPITLEFGKSDSNSNNTGAGYVTAVDEDGNGLKSGDRVEKGTNITYTIVPDEATIYSVRQLYNDDNNSSGANVSYTDNGDGTYSFTKAAGTKANGSTDNTGKTKERIKVCFESQVCEMSYSITSSSTGSGMITVRNNTDGVNKNKTIENGTTFPVNSSITLIFTPDYGSYFDHFSITGDKSYYPADMTKVGESYVYNWNDVSLSDSTTSRIKKISATFTQTFNKTTEKSNHIYNNGMRPNADDEWGAQTDFTSNFEICGAQVKADGNNPDNKALRFISVIDKRILNKAKSYGWVIGVTNQNLDNKDINRNAYALVKDGAYGKTLPCTVQNNTSFGAYGNPDSDKSYVYFTAVVNNIQAQAAADLGLNEDTKIIARPYVELDSERGYVKEGAPSVIYGQYVDFSSGEFCCACSGSYNQIAGLAS